MARQILLVLPDADTEELIYGLVEKNLTQGAGDTEAPVQTCVRSEAEAKQQVKDRGYDLLVTEDCIPPDRKSPLVEKEMRGLKLLEYAKTVRPDLPCIVYTKAWTQRLHAALMDFDACELVVAGESLEEALGKCLDGVFGAPAPKAVGDGTGVQEQEGVIDVEISLRGKQPPQCFYRISENGQLRCSDIIFMTEGEFEDLLRESRELEVLTGDMWRTKLWHIGERLLDDLKRNSTFIRDFAATTRYDIRRCRFVFDIDKRFHPIALEAIVAHDSDDFWMLEAPVTRRLHLDRPISVRGGIKGPPINCLILESSVDGCAREDFPPFGCLDNVPEEAEWLEGFLKHEKEVKPTVEIGKVLRITETTVPEGKSFCVHVQETLAQEGPWHLVHYAGHSYYEKRENKGYVIFPGPPSGKLSPEAIDMEVFGEWLRENRTDIVYMSSCHSSDSSIVFELARNYVPAIVGFRWDIEDRRAAEHARAFYTNLLTGSRSMRIEYAFLKARKETYRKWRKDKTWAAPMLIRQISD